MIANYHTHCKLCGHAKGEIEDYVKEAIRNNLHILGISDHIPYPDDSLGECMKYSNLNHYIDTVKSLKANYHDTIKLHLGLESEHMPEYDWYYDQLLSKDRVEYLLLGMHFFHSGSRIANSFGGIESTEEYITYANSIVEAMSTGFYTYIAHPDLIAMSPFAIDKNATTALDILLEAATKHDYILEFNVNGLRRGIRNYPDGPRLPYPYLPFWEQVAKAGIRVIIGSDCHSPELLYDSYVKEAEALATSLGLKVIKSLDL